MSGRKGAEARGQESGVRRQGAVARGQRSEVRGGISRRLTAGGCGGADGRVQGTGFRVQDLGFRI